MVTILQIDPLDPAQAELFDRWNLVHTAAARHTFGDGASPWTTAELRELYRSTNHRRTACAAVDGDGAVVGAVELQLPLRDNLEAGFVWLSVLPASRRRGIGTFLLRRVEDAAREAGRRTLMSETEWRPGELDAYGETFAAGHGYAPALTSLRSELALPVDRERLAHLAAGGSDYVIETAWDGLPEEWLEDRAELSRRMSTDVPLGELELGEEDWDAERLREEYEQLRASGRRIVESVARHGDSGRLVGYTTLSVSAGSPDLAYQGDTLVMREHRGHGLGLRLKAVNALALMDELPQVSSIRTWNAESNRHMLAVNRQLGFTVDGYEREWQKRL